MDGCVLYFHTPTQREKVIHRNIDFHFPPHRSKRSVLYYVLGVRWMDDGNVEKCKVVMDGNIECVK